ncbi:MAG TPA: insulinase family protein, partial [Bacillota bacterium]|nr:insulinase family protein [Bacillota bacterium]
MEKKYILDDEILYLETLTNGMKVFIQPKPKFIQTFASLYVDFGGRDFRYHRNNIEYNLPRGTAHFLEHLLFENNGDTLTKNFIEANADINAFTARKVTSYYFSTKNQFYPLLLRLFDNFVDFSFSEKTIKKEGKIIAQELSIDDDSESVKAYKSLLRLLYKDDSIYQDIGGTKATIKAIDKTVLEQAIEHFYHPKNMTLLVTGNVDPVQLIETLNSHEFVKKTWPKYYPIERFVDLTDKSVHY